MNEVAILVFTFLNFKGINAFSIKFQNSNFHLVFCLLRFEAKLRLGPYFLLGVSK